MNELSQRIAKLSPEKRALLERRLLTRAATATSGNRIARRAAGLPPRLSFGQQRLWFLEQLEPGSPLHSISTALQMTGHLDLDALQRSLDAIVARHEVLRTTISSLDGTPVPLIASELSVPLPLVDLSDCAFEAREAEVERLIAEQSRRAFDLERELPLRMLLIRCAERQHILVSVWHHIASDAWSAGIFAREFSALYNAFVLGEQSPLAELPIQYGDFAEWQREKLGSAHAEAQLAYWKQQLADSPPALALPTDRPRPPIQSFRGAQAELLLPNTVVEALADIGRRENASLFMVLLAAFDILLYRYTGQDDILVGTPIAGRQAVETEGLIGLFLNTLVLRNDLSGEPTFRELLGRVRGVALDAYANQDVPFERIVEQLRVARDLSRTPLFQVMLNLRNAPRAPLQLTGLSIAKREIEHIAAKHDLTLATVEQPDGLLLQLEYSTDLFDRATIVRLLGHFRTLVDAICADPDASIATLPLLSAAEQRRLAEWNDTAERLPVEQSLVERFEAQARQQPDAIALWHQGTSASYAELNRRSNQLAHYLQARGAGPEVVVGLCLPRSLEAVIGMLAVFKAGAAYVPLDPAYPRERLRYMLQNSGAELVLTRQRFESELASERSRELLSLDRIEHELEQQPVDNPGYAPAPDALAYIIYTSGSTGRPKGVAVEHRAILNRLAWMWRAYPFAAGEVGCHKTSLNFVDSIWEIFGPLLQGIPSAILSDEVVRDPHRLVPELAQHRVTRLWLVPALLRVLLERFPDLRQRLPALDMWVTTGEAIDAQLYRRFVQAMPGSTLFNQYGASEASNTTWYAPSEDCHTLARIPIGRPIANVQIQILDPRRQPVPVGVPGELYIGGVGLARGYVNDPALTAERFIAHPLRAGERLYRSGDLARYRPDGTIEYLGRNDQQIKLRGFRVELGEIEALLARHPQVQQAVVVATENTGEPLFAYLVAPDAPAKLEAVLREYLRAYLPDYMVPAGFMAVAELPLTPSGKVDRNALPAPRIERASEHELAAPQDQLELQLKLIWEHVLGRTPVGVRDDFFELGGHSLLAVQLFAQIEERLGRRLPLAALFQAPTIEGLAKLLRQEGWTPAWSSLTAIQPGGSRQPLFWVPAAGVTALSFAHLARHLGPEQPVYAFQPLGLDGEQPPQSRVQEMAAHYAHEMRLLQPEGPYLLGGRCFGGTVAFEMAQQLYAAGQHVALLLLQDSDPPIVSEPPSAKQLLERLRLHRRRGVVGAVLVWHIRSALRSRYRRLKRKVVDRLGSARARRMQHVLEAHLAARDNYIATTYPGRITLVWSSEYHTYYGDLWHPKWEQLAGAGVDGYIVPAKHMPILRDPYVRALGAQLQAALAALPHSGNDER